MTLVESIIQARQKGVVPVIAEIKRVIPKLAAERGRGRDERDAAYLARCYQEGGAAGISLVTEKKHFGGQPEEDVPAVLRATFLPLLIKDFILDRARVDFYADLVASVDPGFIRRVTLLLIAHKLGNNLPFLFQYIRERGMLALVETREPADLDHLRGVSPPPQLIGINNKNIDELEMGDDLVQVTPEMIACYRQVVGKAIIISESAHRQAADVRRSFAAGADAILAGTAFLVSDYPAVTVANFVRAGEETS